MEAAATTAIADLLTSQTTILTAALGVVIGWVVFRLVRKGTNKAV